MKDRVFMFVVFTLMFAISSGGVNNHQHRSATMMSESGRCCGDPFCPPPPIACQPPLTLSQFQAQR